MSDHSVSCPQTRRTKNRRITKTKIHASKEWKEAVKAFIYGKSCEWCGSKEKLLPHHPFQDTPNEIYGDLYLSGCIPVCSKCHFMYERRHKQLCPRCKTRWMPLKGVETCRECDLELHPQKRQEQAIRKEGVLESRRLYNADQAAKRKAKARKHPCKFHRVRGVCGKSMIGSQCQYSPRKAPKNACGHYKSRKVAT